MIIRQIQCEGIIVDVRLKIFRNIPVHPFLNKLFGQMSQIFHAPKINVKVCWDGAKMKDMKAAGESDMSLLGKKNQYHIALGIYNYESMASKRVDALKAKGFQVLIKPRAKNVTRYWADVAYLPSSRDALDNVVSKVHKTACDNSIELSLLKAE